MGRGDSFALESLVTIKIRRYSSPYLNGIGVRSTYTLRPCIAQAVQNLLHRLQRTKQLRSQLSLLAQYGKALPGDPNQLHLARKTRRAFCESLPPLKVFRPGVM